MSTETFCQYSRESTRHKWVRGAWCCGGDAAHWRAVDVANVNYERKRNPNYEQVTIILTDDHIPPDSMWDFDMQKYRKV